MNARYTLKVTTLENTGLRTRESQLQSWPDVEREILALKNAIALYELSQNEDFILYLMIDGNRAHMTAWEGDICHYLCSERPSDKNDQSVDLGWNAYPSWSVVVGLDTVMRAAKAFVMDGELLATACWWDEEVPE